MYFHSILRVALIVLSMSHAFSAGSQLDSWNDTPEDIAYELCHAIAQQKVYAPAKAASILSLLSVNKRMRSYQDHTIKKILPTLEASTTIHPWLVKAYVLPRVEWTALIEKEIEKNKQCAIHIQQQHTMVASNATCNHASATVVGLMDAAERIALLHRSPLTKAVHEHIAQSQEKSLDMMAVILKTSGDPLVYQPRKSEVNDRCCQSYDFPIFFKYNSDNTMYSLTTWYAEPTDTAEQYCSPHVWRTWGPAHSEQLQDLCQTDGYCALISSPETQTSSIVSWKERMNPHDILRYWMSAHRKQFVEGFEHVPKQSVVFQGAACKLAYDDAASEVVAFDAEARELFRTDVKTVYDSKRQR